LEKIVVAKPYDWTGGAVIEEHSKRKHKIVREYIYQYIVVRCQLPQQQRFRLAVVDGFAGAGRYGCGTPGSPIIFIEEFRRSIDAINSHRAAQGLGALNIECLLVLNDASEDAIELLKANVAPLLADIAQNVAHLHLHTEYLNGRFEDSYPEIKRIIAQGSFRNVIFNLDQCGHSHVERTTIIDIMRSYPSTEVFYTFAIESLIAFLSKSEPKLLKSQLSYLGLDSLQLEELQGVMSKLTWLGTAERLVFEAFKGCSSFVSPFSINNPGGWRYWLIHFANSYRARQVYNDVLHRNSSMQAHFGKSGLHMLAYDPTHEGGTLYLFDDPGRDNAKGQLFEDIPRVISESGDVVKVGEFYESIYNSTPAHTDDIHESIITNPDIQVITPQGGERRKANTIDVGDVLKLRIQRTFFPLFIAPRKD
jgi:three-Cys-motif partner protein